MCADAKCTPRNCRLRSLACRFRKSLSKSSEVLKEINNILRGFIIYAIVLFFWVFHAHLSVIVSFYRPFVFD